MIETIKSGSIYDELLPRIPTELLGNPYRRTIDTLSNGRVLFIVSIDLVFRNDVYKYFKRIPHGNGFNWELTLAGLLSKPLLLNSCASNAFRNPNMSYRVTTDFTTDVPYIQRHLLSTMAPWETYDDFMKGFSHSLQLDVFMKLVSDLVYMDCEAICKAKTAKTKLKKFIEAVDSDYAEFVKRVTASDMVDLDSIWAYAQCRVDAGKNLNTVVTAKYDDDIHQIL